MVHSGTLTHEYPERTDVTLTYLVLGGNGFIGSHLVDRLAGREGVAVRALDVFNQEPRFVPNPAVTAVRGSAYDATDLAGALDGVDVVVHCLSATSPFTADSDPYADIDGLRRSVEIFDRCVAAGVGKIGFVSSGGAVYGALTETKIAAEDDVPMPVSPYGMCKLATEHYLEYFNRKYGTRYVVYRLSNPYGPRQPIKPGHGVVSTFLRAVREGTPLTLLGDGTASRDYIYVEDAAAMIADTLPLDNIHPVYNVGSGEQTSLGDIVAALETAVGTRLAVRYEPAPRTTLQRTSISVDRFEAEFGRGDRTDLCTGLARTIAWLNATPR
jgi:UDP-glucose 4-epimerase